MTIPTNRRTALSQTAISSMGFMAWLSHASPAYSQAASEGELLPFLDEPRTPPNRLDWEVLDSWLTPQDQVFSVQHYGVPEFDYNAFRLEIAGMVERPKQFTVDQLKALPKAEVVMTLECSGNGSNPGFMNAVCNSRWGGTPLAPLLQACGIDPAVTEVVFFGEDKNEEILRPGTKRELKVEVPFGRSMSIGDALRPDLLLAYERNGEPIEHRNGAPIRLIVPGWYGVANVKWLTRIECRDKRYMGKYMARDYVTVRGERLGDEMVFVESSVTRIQLKSVVARIMRLPASDSQTPAKAFGVAWDDGTGIARVEVKVDDQTWRDAIVSDKPSSKYGWKFFSIELGQLSPGRHSIVSRAIDVNGRVQPAAEDDEIALKKTYWEAYQQWPRSFAWEG